MAVLMNEALFLPVRLQPLSALYPELKEIFDNNAMPLVRSTIELPAQLRLEPNMQYTYFYCTCMPSNCYQKEHMGERPSYLDKCKVTQPHFLRKLI